MDSESQSNQLVEHFFRQESANLVSVMTRAFGTARIELVEDSVQSAIVQAMNTWKIQGIPDNPAAWLAKTAKNRVIDGLRKEKSHEKALAFSSLLQPDDTHRETEWLDEWLDAQALPDSLLRMMFVCCHPSLDRKSQIALTLKILCGFGVGEVARGLMTSRESAKKRIQRARTELAERQISTEFPPEHEVPQRLSVVHDVLYLLFNEGYSTTVGHEPIRDEVCEEAARLCHMLCQHPTLGTPESKALLALMLFHAARLPARTDALGQAVLLDEQDRQRWDQGLIEQAKKWLVRSVDENPSRFHFEAIIAQCHCTAKSVKQTPWDRIVQFYDRLIESFPSPLYRLNRAIARCQAGDPKKALNEIQSLIDEKALENYYLLDCAKGHIYQEMGMTRAASECYLKALASEIPSHQEALIQRRLNSMSSSPP